MNDDSDSFFPLQKIKQRYFENGRWRSGWKPEFGTRNIRKVLTSLTAVNHLGIRFPFVGGSLVDIRINIWYERVSRQTNGEASGLSLQVGTIGLVDFGWTEIIVGARESYSHADRISYTPFSYTVSWICRAILKIGSASQTKFLIGNGKLDIADSARTAISLGFHSDIYQKRHQFYADDVLASLFSRELKTATIALFVKNQRQNPLHVSTYLREKYAFRLPPSLSLFRLYNDFWWVADGKICALSLQDKAYINFWPRKGEGLGALTGFLLSLSGVQSPTGATAATGRPGKS